MPDNNEIQTVADVPDDYMLITDSYEVSQILARVTSEDWDNGGLFVDTDNGEYSSVLWFRGNVPYLTKEVRRVV